jgi:methylenetetrahydrofolate reductase (NADPH)
MTYPNIAGVCAMSHNHADGPAEQSSPPTETTSESKEPSIEQHHSLAERLHGFVVFTEVYPPNGADAMPLIERFAPLRGRVDAVSVADSPMAVPLMSGLATAALFEWSDMPAVLNLTCRDRNIIGLQSDILGAAALGIQGIFCITGDSPEQGDHPEASSVYELDSLQLVQLARQLRDDGMFESGRRLETLPHYIIGAAGSLTKAPLAEQVERTAAKIGAGAQFIQTSPVFDLEQVRDFATRLEATGSLQHTRMLAGVAVVTGVDQALWVQSELPGAAIPDTFVDKLASTPSPAQQRVFGLEYAAHMIRQLREMPGIGGILLYPYDSTEQDIEAIDRLLDMTELW